MLRRIHGISFILKMIFIFLVIIFLILNGSLAAPSVTGKQSFDWLLAAILSIGLGSVFCLVLYDKKKE